MTETVLIALCSACIGGVTGAILGNISGASIVAKIAIKFLLEDTSDKD